MVEKAHGILGENVSERNSETPEKEILKTRSNDSDSNPFNHISKSSVEQPTPGSPTEPHKERCPSPETSCGEV